MDEFDESRSLSHSALAGLQETQGDRVLKALKKVYEKIHHLEKDRLSAKHSVEIIERQETEQPDAAEFFRRLATAEARCKLLEEQLVHVRHILSEFNSSNSSASSKTISSDASSIRSISISKQEMPELRKVENLPPVSLFLEHLMKEKKQRTKHHRKSPKKHTTRKDRVNEEPIEIVIVEREQEPRICESFMERVQVEEPLKRSFIASQTPCKLQHSRRGRTRRTSESNHYHLNMLETPFVTGTSTGKSHSLRANIQNLYSMVKHCNPALCEAAPLHRRRRSASLDRPLETTPRSRATKRRSNSTSSFRPRSLSGDNCRSCNRGGILLQEELRDEGHNRRVLEIKMTTPTGPDAKQCSSTLGDKRRQLLHDLQQLQYALMQQD